MTYLDYKTVLYSQDDGSWVAEIPAIPGCYVLIPTREQAMAELSKVFDMIAQEYREKVSRCPLPRRKSCMPSATARDSRREGTTSVVP